MAGAVRITPSPWVENCTHCPCESGEPQGGGTLLSGIVDFFEEGIAADKGVLELIGNDVAAFCDDLVKDSRTYADIHQETISGEPGTAPR